MRWVGLYSISDQLYSLLNCISLNLNHCYSYLAGVADKIALYNCSDVVLLFKWDLIIWTFISIFPWKIEDKFSTLFVMHLVSIVWPIALILFSLIFYQTREREDDEIVEALNRYTVKLQNSLQIINSTEMWFSFFLYC